jgi:hypothetical protein
MGFLGVGIESTNVRLAILYPSCTVYNGLLTRRALLTTFVLYQGGPTCLKAGGEERHLAEADRHIARAQELIRLQQQRIEQMQAQGMPTDEREELLSTMLESFALMKRHRDLIWDRLTHLNQSP